MLKIKEILENYKDYGTCLDDRFGARFIDFLTIEEMESIGFELKEEYKKDWQPKEWNEQNIIEQLKEDIEFGIEKAEDERGISSSLMFEVVKSWLKVLEDEEILEYFEDYYDYGLNGFYPARDKYILNDEIEVIEEDNSINHLVNYAGFDAFTNEVKLDYLYEMITRIIDKINEMEDK